MGGELEQDEQQQAPRQASQPAARMGTRGSTRGARRQSATPAAPDDALRAKALVVHERLCAAYGCPIAFFHELDPLSELVSSLLSHRTRNADSGRAFRQLRARFPDWSAVRDAPTAEVEAAIAPVTWPEQKAPRIQAVLRAIGERRGGMLDASALDFLAELPVPEARAWLEAIPGIGPKTSAAVLLFSRLRLPALPVDSHHHRVAQRLGLVPPDMPVGPAHAWLEAMLPPEWDAQTVYDDHEALMLHGQRCCFHHDPACPRCPVLDLCPTGQARLARAGGTTAGTRTRPRLADTLSAGDDAPLALPFDEPLTPAPGAVPGEVERPRRVARDGAADERTERPLPPTGLRRAASAARKPAISRGASRRSDETMSVHPHPERGPAPQAGDHNPQGDRAGQSAHAGQVSDADRERLQKVHADPQQLEQEAAEQRQRREASGTGQHAANGVNDPEHYKLSPESRAHGTHGKGFSDEELVDERATDTGDNPQLRTAGGGGNNPPEPNAFREQSAGNMGGAGWGSEQVGGSVVDRRPDDSRS